MFSAFLFTSCQKCVTCENETTGDLEQLCRGAGIFGQGKEYQQSIDDFEDKGYVCENN